MGVVASDMDPSDNDLVAISMYIREPQAERRSTCRVPMNPALS